MKPKPKIGQTLYDLNVGNDARNVPQVLKPVIVTKVGVKYFTCERTDGWKCPVEYRIKDWKQNTDACVNHKLYETPEEWDCERETKRIKDKLQKLFNDYHCNIPLDTLRAIEMLIGTTS
jgi:hypothetical protein